VVEHLHSLSKLQCLRKAGLTRLRIHLEIVWKILRKSNGRRTNNDCSHYRKARYKKEILTGIQKLLFQVIGGRDTKKVGQTKPIKPPTK